MSGMSRQHMPAAASLANQHSVSQPSSEADTAEAGVLGAEAGDASMASSTAGWFTGAAGQLAASKTGISSTSELGSTLGDTYAGMSARGLTTLLACCHSVWMHGHHKPMHEPFGCRSASHTLDALCHAM